MASNRLITSTYRGVIKIWDLLEGQCLFSFLAFSHKSAVCILDNVPNEANMFLSGDEDRIIRIWDLKRPKKKCINKILIRLRFKLMTALLLFMIKYASKD